MRLLSLDLLRYGHLTDTRLRFPEGAGLHVVLGENEAGKSTALAAIGDALFGFPHLTRYAFQHDTSALRIGFEVAARDGTRAAFIRRKGRQNTLLDAAEEPVAEAALQRLLGGAGRDLFEKAYGLNAAALRDGAQSLIEGGGAAGEGLLAGMGLPHLRRAIERLEKAAEELHGTRHKARRLARAHEDWQAAQRHLDAAAVKPAEWLAAGEALERVAQELRSIEAEAAALKREEVRLRRARAVRQPLAELAQLRAELAAVADGPALPEEAGARLARLVAALDKAAQDEARETEAAERLDAELAALRRDPAVLALQDAVDALAATRATAEGAARDLPGLRREVAAQRDRIAAAASRLGIDAPPEAVRDALPPERHRLAAQRLIRGRAALLTKLEAAELALRAAERQCDRARLALAEAPEPPHAAPLRRAIEAARAEGPLDREIAAAGRELAEAEERASAALAALDLWAGDARALAACRLPLPAACDDAARRLDEAAATQEAAHRALAELSAEIGTLEADLAHLARGETVPTRERVAAARARRDDAWAAIRTALGAGAQPDAAAQDAFEGLRDAADRLADARADDAQRVNDYAAKTARLALLRERRAAAEAAASAAASEREATAAAWRALWAPAGLVPLSPAAMREWRAARNAVMALEARAAELRGRRDGLVERRNAARALLAPFLSASEDLGIAALLARAEGTCAAQEEAAANHRKLRETEAAQAEAVEVARAACAEAAAALEAGAEAWHPALAALGLPGTAGLEAVQDAIEAWGVVAEAAAAWRAAAQRGAEMDAALGALARETAALAERLGEMVREEPPATTAARLARRLAEAREAETEARGLARQVAERREAASAAQEAGRAAEAELGRLHAAAGTADLPALAAAVERNAQRRALRDAIARQEGALREGGDGLPEAELRAEAEGFDPDDAAIRLPQIELRQAELNARRTALGAERQRVESEMAAMERGKDAAGLAQDARQALAEAQAAAERFARLHTAHRLLRAGIERLRQAQQGPMLRRATAHFALLTGGRYVRLATEEEDGPPVLRAMRDDGTACPMEQLSEGARDQLYLALRVAALEAQAEGAEPLPFVADDLLASFDETRAGAALELLARVGQRVQVILFTHHAHVAALASSVPGAAVLRMPAGLPLPAVPALALPAA